MTSENIWSRRYGKVLKSQNTGLSLVSWVWHLKLPVPRWYGRYCAYPEYQYQVPTLPTVPVKTCFGRKVNSVNVRKPDEFSDSRDNDQPTDGNRLYVDGVKPSYLYGSKSVAIKDSLSCRKQECDTVEMAPWFASKQVVISTVRCIVQTEVRWETYKGYDIKRMLS